MAFVTVAAAPRTTWKGTLVRLCVKKVTASHGICVGSSSAANNLEKTMIRSTVGVKDNTETIMNPPSMVAKDVLPRTSSSSSESFQHLVMISLSKVLPIAWY